MPKSGPARPRAASCRNRLLSAMPSSMCWPCGDIAQRCAETTCLLAKRVGALGPVEDAAAIDPRPEVGRDRDVGRGRHDAFGEVAASFAAMSPSIRPKASCVDSLVPRGTGRLRGTATGGGVVPARAGRRRAARLREIRQARRPAGRARRTAPTRRPRRPPCCAGRTPSGRGSSARRGCPCARRRAGRSP